MRARAPLAALALLLAASACAGQNKYERLAQKITLAVQADDPSQLQGVISPDQTIPRVKLAEWSDELQGQGKLLSLREATPCTVAGAHCFQAQFQKHLYLESMQLDDHGKVVMWKFHMAGQPESTATP